MDMTSEPRSSAPTGPSSSAASTTATSPSEPKGAGRLTQPSTFQTRDGIPHALARFPDAYRNEIVAFADTITNGTASTVDHHDTLAAFQVALACHQSVAERQPVDLTKVPRTKEQRWALQDSGK